MRGGQVAELLPWAGLPAPVAAAVYALPLACLALGTDVRLAATVNAALTAGAQRAAAPRSELRANELEQFRSLMMLFSVPPPHSHTARDIFDTRIAYSNGVCVFLEALHTKGHSSWVGW